MQESAKKQSQSLSLVQKSNPLLSLYSAPYTLPMFKLLDTYLLRIDIQHPENREIVFERRELEKIFGSRISSEVLDSWGRQLATQAVAFENSSCKQFEKMWISLFDKAYAFLNDEKCYFVMRCSETAVPLFFNIEHIGYIKYRLQNIMALSSRYTYLLFVHIERNRFRKTWTITVDDLRKELGCTEEYYNDYTRFSQKIIKRSQQELYEKTGIKIEIVPQKKLNRKVVALQISILSAIDEPKPAQIKPEVTEPQWWTPLAVLNFSEREVAVVKANLQTAPDAFFSLNETTVTMKWYRNLEVKVAELTRRDAETKINDKFAYLVAAIRNDIQNPPKAKQTRNTSRSAEVYLNRYDQRDYSPDEMLAIERKLIQKSFENSLGIEVPASDE